MVRVAGRGRRRATPWGGVLAAAVLAVGTGAPGGAPAHAAEALTLAAAIDRALAGSPLLEVAARAQARAAAGEDRARAAYFPRLDATYGYTRSDQPVYAFGSTLNQGRFTEANFAVSRLNSPGALDNFRAALTLSQPVYTGGRASLGAEQAALARQAADLDAEGTRQAVVFQVVRAWAGLRLAQERLEALEAARRAAEANLALADVRVRAGLAVESDLLAARVRLARVDGDQAAARGQVTAAVAGLNDAMGAPVDSPVEAGEPLALRPERPDADTDADTLARRSDFQALRLREASRERDVRLARAEFLPTLGLEGTVEANNQEPFSDGQGSWSVGAVLRWNFLAGGADRARVREAEAAHAQARALLARAASQVGLEVREARAQLDAARDRARVAERVIAEAEETLRVVRVRYRGGVTTIVELLAAEAAVTETRLRRAEALHDHTLALAARERALGRLDRAAFE